MSKNVFLVTHTSKQDVELSRSCFFLDSIPPYYACCSDMVNHPDFKFAHFETETTHIYIERLITPRGVILASTNN